MKRANTRNKVVPVIALSIAIGFSAMAVDTAAAQTQPAYEAGLRMAKRRHVANPRCYAQVFRDYATLNRNGRWTWPTAGRRTYRVQQVYQHDLFYRCGIA